MFNFCYFVLRFLKQINTAAIQSTSMLCWVSRAKSKGREGGAGAGELGKVVVEVRRAMSVQMARSQALCLLERLSQFGPGARAAGERRKMGHSVEETRRRQAQAYHLAHRNRGLCRVGRAFVP